MNDSCELFPIVKGKQSSLYQKILDFTNKNRPLTNLIYALATTDEVKNTLKEDEIDSLGEVKFNILRDKLNLSTLLNSGTQMKAKAEALGAIDSSGVVISYDDVNTIFDRVIDFNERETDYKATITYDSASKKFKIGVDIVNAENFLNESSYKGRKAEYDAVTNFLRAIVDTNNQSLFSTDLLH